MTFEEIKARVKESYENAIENGYDLNSQTAENVAEDMQTFDADLEDVKKELLVRAIKDIRTSG